MTIFPDYKKLPTYSLIPYARNSRTHSDVQVSQIAASIKEFGFLNPIIIDGDNGIIAGHGRVLAAQKLGIDELPCVEASHLTDVQCRAYVIADNKLALNADWDESLLRVELGELTELKFDISLVGFSEIELGSLFDQESLDEEPELKEEEYHESYEVVVECDNEQDQQEAYEALQQEGYKCRVLSL